MRSAPVYPSHCTDVTAHACWSCTRLFSVSAPTWGTCGDAFSPWAGQTWKCEDVILMGKPLTSGWWEPVDKCSLMYPVGWFQGTRSTRFLRAPRQIKLQFPLVSGLMIHFYIGLSFFPATFLLVPHCCSLSSPLKTSYLYSSPWPLLSDRSPV